MRKFIGILVAILCLVCVFGIVTPLAADGGYNYGQGRDLTGVEFVKITQADIMLDPANPGMPAFVKTDEIYGHLRDLNFVPVREIPPVFSYVWISNGMSLQIAQVRPIYNYGEDLDMTGVECAKLLRTDIIKDSSPSNVGIPVHAQKAVTPSGYIIYGHIWDLDLKPVLEVPPVGAYVWICDGQAIYLVQVR